MFSTPFFPLYQNRCTVLYFPLLPVVLRLHSKTAKAFLFVVFEEEEKNPSVHRRVNRISLDLLVYAMSNARLVTANCCL